MLLSHKNAFYIKQKFVLFHGPLTEFFILVFFRLSAYGRLAFFKVLVFVYTHMCAYIDRYSHRFPLISVYSQPERLVYDRIWPSLFTHSVSVSASTLLYTLYYTILHSPVCSDTNKLVYSNQVYV